MAKSQTLSLPLCVENPWPNTAFGAVDSFSTYVYMYTASSLHHRWCWTYSPSVRILLMFTPSQGSCHANYAINRLILTSLLAIDHSSDSRTVSFKEPQCVQGNLYLWLGAMETFSRPIRQLYGCIGCLLGNYFLNCRLRLVCGGGLYVYTERTAQYICQAFFSSTCQYTIQSVSILLSISSAYSSRRCPYYNITSANKTLLMSRHWNFSGGTRVPSYSNTLQLVHC